MQRIKGRLKMFNHNDFIYNLITKFRVALEKACNTDLLKRDIAFRSFPKRCCGDTSELLAEYLKINGIETIYVCADNDGQSHAWLVLKDSRVKEPQEQIWELPPDIFKIYSTYSPSSDYETIHATRYEESDLSAGIIIDITGDQFGEDPVFYGNMDNLHRKFDFMYAYDSQQLTDGRLRRIYREIMKYI